MEAHMVSVGSDRIAVYSSKGAGPAALLIHGNSCSSRSYQYQLESPLGETFRLAALDLPGHGQSSNAANPSTTYNLPGYARVVVEVAKQLGLSDAVFVGWSLGGHIVLEAVNQLPNARGFVIFGTPPLAFPPAMNEAFLPNPAMGAAFNPTLSEAEARGFAAACLKPGASIPETFLADIQRTDGNARSTLAASIAPNGYADEVAIVATMQQPLAVFHGAHEQLINLDYINRLSMPTLWRGAAQVIANAGHSPHWENPATFNALLEAFLHETAQHETANRTHA